MGSTSIIRSGEHLYHKDANFDEKGVGTNTFVVRIDDRRVIFLFGRMGQMILVFVETWRMSVIRSMPTPPILCAIVLCHNRAKNREC